MIPHVDEPGRRLRREVDRATELGAGYVVFTVDDHRTGELWLVGAGCKLKVTDELVEHLTERRRIAKAEKVQT